MKMLKKFSFQNLKRKLGHAEMEVKTSDSDDKSTQTVQVETQETSSQVSNDDINTVSESDAAEGVETKENADQDSMMRGNADKRHKGAIYHELDFSLKNPILYCSSNGGIIVRSKFLASKPPSSSSLVSKQQRWHKTKSCGFDIAKGKVERPKEGVRLKGGDSHHNLHAPKRSASGTPQRTPLFSPKFRKHEKTRKCQLQLENGSRVKKADDIEEYMFLDFTKRVKQRSKGRSLNICGKTSTL